MQFIAVVDSAVRALSKARPTAKLVSPTVRIYVGGPSQASDANRV